MKNMVETPKKTEKEEARESLLRWLKPGDTVYTVLRSVSRSGMSRRISVVIIRPGEGHMKGRIETLHPNYSVAKLLGYRLNKGFNDSLTVSGCGMDMGFALIYNLSQALFGGKEGNALKQEWL